MKSITDWQTQIDDKYLDNFTDLGFFVLDNVFDDKTFKNLQTESGFVSYKTANLATGERLASIRGDSIRWIDKACPYGMAYVSAIHALGQFFNQVFYTDIKRCEAHYAHYKAGFGYDWHIDNPKGRDDRVVSAVFYLNDDWSDELGGHILLIDKQGSNTQLTPKGNRLVVFDSNLRHKVAITQKDRFSIATWLRRDVG